jgi:hypothetical protein
LLTISPGIIISLLVKNNISGLKNRKFPTKSGFQRKIRPICLRKMATIFYLCTPLFST